MTDPSVQQVLWNELSSHIIRNFYHPDLEALRCVFAAVHAHYSGADPVWLFVTGPPGSGKTSIAINCISELPDVIVASDLTPRSFLAGKAAKSSYTLLNRKSLILAFKDFTTLVSKREESQREIISILREVFDGKVSYATAEAHRKWEGKCTVIAAVTPAIERAWSIHRELGERFNQVRWQNTRKPTEAARMARAQLGQERNVAAMMRAHAKDFFDAASPEPAELPEPLGNRIDAAAVMIASLRRHVIRESGGQRQIIEVPPPEEPTRLAKGICTVACHHGALFNREVVSGADMTAAMRAAVDTIPATPLAILRNIPPDQTSISARDLREMTGLPRNTLVWHLDELEAMGALQIIRTLDDDRSAAYTPAFAELWAESRLF